MGNNNMHRKVSVGAKLQRKDVRIDGTDVALIRGAGHGYRIIEFELLGKQIPLAENHVFLFFLVLSVLCLFAKIPFGVKRVLGRGTNEFFLR